MIMTGEHFHSAPTVFPVGLEQAPDGATLAHSLSVPGCVAGGPTPEAALEALVAELTQWLRFLEARGRPVPAPGAELEISVNEWVESGAAVDRGESDACFEDDLRPLSDAEITDALRVLGDLRGVLLAQLRRTPDAELDRARPGGWTVRRMADELARAQWWLLTRLGRSPMAEVPERLLGRLDTAMALVVQHLTELSPEQRAAALEIDGEVWTPRKVVRRLLWVEWALGGSALRALELEVEPR